MEINKRQVMLCAKTVEHLYELARSTEEIDERKILELIHIAISLSAYHFNDQELEKIKDEVEYNCQVKQLDGTSITNDYNHYDWYTERLEGEVSNDSFFWDRYRNYLLDDQHLSLNVVNKLDNTILNELMNYLGDPLSDTEFLRRGLIIGDVQSGKTSTYIGLICKAADAGYKVVILLTGTIENLRNQTQKRVEEGIVGIDISQCTDGVKAIRVGVGKDDKPIKVTAMTSRDYDFVGNMNRITTSLESHKVVICVIKKNTTVLTKLINWLVSLNATPTTGRIPYPMILIDDEADNASVNTNKPEEDPTKINSLIRELAYVFTQTTYVGFTATPFANVFISPDTVEDMETHDLFPENFIYSLPAPTNYIGVNKIFFEDSRYKSSLINIDDAGVRVEDGYPFYFKHKKDWDDDIPKSLTDAIYAFLLVNAIRDLRRDIDAPRTMMVNMSRFVNVQHVIKAKIEKIYEQAFDAIKYNLSTDFDKSMQYPILKKIHKIWEEQYTHTEFSWDEISAILFKSVEHIQIMVINSSKSSDVLDYEHNKGLRVIAVGGLTLSRGITLEGLVISYFYRNTSTFDVLMQMGRWFGYRRGYDDLFRIWTSNKSAEWYAEIAEATELLKDDIKRMRDHKKTPKEFGMRVRNDSKELRITAANKMRLANDKVEQLSYYGDVVETPYLMNDLTINQENLLTVENLVNNSITAGIAFERLATQGNHYALMDVPKELIISLMNEIRTSRYNRYFDSKQIYNFLISSIDSIINKWDVVFMEGTKEQRAYSMNCRDIYPIKRDFSVDEYEGRINIGSRGKLAGTADGKQCLNDEDVIESAKIQYQNDYFIQKGVPWTNDKAYPSNTWFKYVDDRKPLLIIYLIRLDAKNPVEVEKRCSMIFANTPAVGFAMGLPRSNGKGLEIHKYKVNQVYTKYEIEEVINENEEE